jgi:hypothetical protein
MRRYVAGMLLGAVLTCAEPSTMAGAADPPWLLPRPGTLARVDTAPWLVSDEPEAALTESAASSARDFTASAQRPDDVRYEPIGAPVRIERILPGAQVVLVHGLEERWEAYAPFDRLVPAVPAGTALVAAGGFEGYADFYKNVDTRESGAERLATGSRLIVLGTGVAPYDPDSPGLVRLHVRITSGALRGRNGWVATGYTGLPVARLPDDAEVAERACSCRLIQFDANRP